MDSIQQKIAELWEQLRNLEAVRSIIGDALTDQKKAELETRLQALLNLTTCQFVPNHGFRASQQISCSGKSNG